MNDKPTYQELENQIAELKKQNEILKLSENSDKITERKPAIEALKESEEKYRSIFESFQDIYYRANNKGIITELSPSVFKISGYKPDELIGNRLLCLSRFC